MISLVLLIFTLIANIVAVLLVYHSYGKKADKNDKIKNTLIIIGAMYIATLVIYYLSGIGIGKFNNASNLRTYMMMAFVPINVILLIPFSIYSFLQAKEKKITKQILNKRLFIVEIAALVIIVIEFITFRSLQSNMKKTSDKIAQNEIAENTAVVENTIVEENAIEENTVKQNEIVNALNEN